MKEKERKMSNKLILLSLVTIGILFTITGLLYNSFAFTEPIKSISFTSEKLNYNEKEPGSFQIEKSANWVEKGKARITFNIDTVEKKKNSNTDVFVLLDASDSMKNENIENVKRNIIDFTDILLSDSNNNLSIISFNNKAQVISELTNDKRKIENSINNIKLENKRNFYSAFLKLEELFSEYTFKEEKECIVLLLTSGSSNIKVSNNYYQYLKTRYPFVHINAIQYEKSEIIESLTEITDEQYTASKDDLLDVLKKSTDIVESYSKFELTDYIDTKYFYIQEENDIKVDKGKAILDKENQKVTWILDNMISGDYSSISIDIYLKDGIKETILSTNQQESVKSKIATITEDITENKTPILKTEYQVHYELNKPSNCEVQNIPSENHNVFDKVEIENTNLKCNNYQFQGWKITTKEVTKLNTDYFIMPEGDVTLVAEWTNISLEKSMDGIVQTYQQPYLQSITEGYSEKMWTYKDKITKIVFQDQIKNVPGSVESWDLSETENYGVVGYLVPNIDNTTYTVYIQGENEIIVNENCSYFFDGFSKLESIENIKYLNTTNVQNMGDMFRNCMSLIELDLSSFDTRNVRYLNALFLGCSSLKNINLQGWNTQNVTHMRYMFYKCNSLSKIDLSSFQTPNLKNIESAFMGCKQLVEINISTLDTSNVTSMVDLFRQCNLLTSIDISNFKTNKVTNMDSMFRECRSITELDLSNFDTSNVITLDSMFRDCTGLININLKSFNTQNVSTLRNMFYHCESLTQLDLSNFDTSTVLDMSGIFRSCYSLTNLDISSFNTLNVIDMHNMFYGCKNLVNLDVSHFDTSKVMRMENMFYNCKKLENLNLGVFDTSNITDFSNFFTYDELLTTTLTIKNPNVVSYPDIFYGTSRKQGIVTINYTAQTEALVDEMINSKSPDANVVKGVLVEN